MTEPRNPRPHFPHVPTLYQQQIVRRCWIARARETHWSRMLQYF